MSDIAREDTLDSAMRGQSHTERLIDSVCAELNAMAVDLKICRTVNGEWPAGEKDTLYKYDHLRRMAVELRKLKSAHTQAPVRGEVEPVAYMFSDEYGRTKTVLGKETAEHWCPPDETITPLYTHPPAKVPEGYALVPKSMCLTQEDVEFIVMMTGWGDEDQNDAEGVLWVGPVEDDDGNQTYGLNISCAECMEEGAIQLVQFDEPAATLEAEWVKPTGRHHNLKTDSSVFRQSLAGLKPWEIRGNDREFSVGDTVTLQETENTGKEMAEGAPLVFTGRTISGVIGYLLAGPIYGLSDGWCIFTLQATPPQEQ